VKNLVILFGAIVCLGGIRAAAQQKSTPGTKTSSAQAGAAKSPAGKKSAATKPTPGSSPANGQSDLFGGSSDKRPTGPTEITASQEAQFDTKARTGVFIGNVKVVDPQFTLTSNRLTVHLNRDEDGGGLSEADAEGNVVIVHVNQPKTQPQTGQASATPSPAAARPAVPGATPIQGQQPTTSIGKAEKALYEAKDGSITLTGWPQVTQGANTHIATSPGVKMVLYKDGRMQTYGSTRTLIEDKTTATNNPNANGAQ
jgi:lipopolysaccharide export system protein LptA